MLRDWRAVVATAALAAALSSAAAQSTPWPSLAAPPGARVETVAADMVFNNMPSRVVRFEVDASDKEVLAFYRKQFGERHVLNTVKGDQVIATRQGDHFHTVQLHVLGPQRVQGTVMTTRLRQAGTSAVSADTEKLMPAATSIVSTMQSDDAGKRSLMVLGLNRNSPRANRDHVVQALEQRGYRIVREDEIAASGALSLVLAAPAEEVAVTIADAGPYRSVLIHRTKESR